MIEFKRTVQAVILVLLGASAVFAGAVQNVSAATVQRTDYQQSSFSRIVDWYDYVRQYATENGLTPPSTDEHAYIYTNYVNIRGFQLFYVGLVNATHNGRFVTIPLQSFFEHYKTPTGKTAVTASSFISLVAFNESASTIHPDTPDISDTVYASFSLGIDVTGQTGRPIPLVATSEVIPLTSSSDGLHWTWGLKYNNLNAIWWRINPNPLFPTWDSTPKGIAQYTELTFNYDLTINPSTKTAKLVSSYTIGRVTDLWLLTRTPAAHLNSTGTYYANGTLANSQTVYQYLTQAPMKLSIVLAQKTILASQKTSDEQTRDTEVNGTTVDNDAEHDVSATAVNTSAGDGERVFSADFGVKPTYQLYDSSDANPTTIAAQTRTVVRGGWARNPAFAFQAAFMGFLPLFVAHVAPELYQRAKTGLLDLSISNYLYIISYRTWNGYRIVHDPDYTAFFEPSSNLGVLAMAFIVIAAAATIGGVVALILRRRRAGSIAVTTQSPVPGPSPAPTGSPGPA